LQRSTGEPIENQPTPRRGPERRPGGTPKKPWHCRGVFDDADDTLTATAFNLGEGASEIHHPRD